MTTDTDYHVVMRESGAGAVTLAWIFPIKREKGTQLISIMSCVISTPYFRHDDGITAAEEVAAHFHKLDIRKPLREALEALKQ